MKRKVVLVYSRSPLARDERVQRQIRLCSSEYDVVSVGLGPYDGPVIRHIDLATIVPTNTGRATDIPGAGEDVLTSRDNACESSGDELEHPEGLASLDPPGDEFLPASVMSPSQILKMSSAVLHREGLLVLLLRTLRKVAPGASFLAGTIDAANARRRLRIKARRDAIEILRREGLLALLLRTLLKAVPGLFCLTGTFDAVNAWLNRALTARNPLSLIQTQDPGMPFPAAIWQTNADAKALLRSFPRKERARIEQIRKDFSDAEALEFEKQHALVLKVLKDIDFDLAFANDLTSINVVVPLAKTKNARVIYDAHEFSPGQRVLSADTAWSLSYAAYILGKYLPLCDQVLTVCDSLSEEYVRWFDIPRPAVITSASPFIEITPSPLDADRVRLVHHGIAGRQREIEKMIDTVLLLDERFTLDFYVLTPDLEYFAELQARCEGTDRIRFLPTVPSSKLAELTNRYDMGFFLLAPVTFNQKHALPNKLFEFVQARLGIAIGPSPEMASYVQKYDLGVVAKDFTASSMADALTKVTPESLSRFKANSHRHAAELSAAPQMESLKKIVKHLMAAEEFAA